MRRDRRGRRRRDGRRPGAVTGSGNETGSLSEEEYDATVQEARQTTQSFKKQLVGELQTAMQEGGAEAGIRVCAETAPAITANVSRQKGWKVTRVSRKYRNPVLGMPDAWEAETLDRFQQRHQQGEDWANLSRSEVVQEPSGEYVRVMSPLATQDLCLNCHGTDDRISDEVQDLLDRRYPHDRATGYGPGELRGAVSIKIPIEG